MIYLAYHFLIAPKKPATEILIAELGQIGFESFVETETGVVAYIPKEEAKHLDLTVIYILQNPEFKISYRIEEISQVNWNIEWEKNFNPIQVDDLVSIRAPFHENPQLEYDIVIEPKMSFGTGHHETTHMMVQHLISMDIAGLRVLDMGCGTGILAIFAAMKGAKSIDAIDIDAWCYENSIENCERNGYPSINVFQGDASMLITQKYDLIIANINRNILLNDLPVYVQCLNPGGQILLSGFYREDIPMLDGLATDNGLKLQKTIERNNWVALKYLLKNS
ncbi:50S ribosomal protein L11 methyltransferase [Flavobacteriaceae bacterium F08102]|nr:50S ribosomal protein L11 methyltransferase [Flavobacteriaceae bacterium F08102]